MKSRPTISDVAAHAKVSKVTVSYVLNGRSDVARIRPETADRVRAAARLLDYRPNPVARTLKTRRSGAIAVVFQYANLFAAGSAFVNEVMRGVCEGATERGVDLVLHTRATDSPEDEIASLTDGRVDGILVLRDSDDPVLAGLCRQTSIPVVSFFCAAGEAWADAENAEGGRMGIAHLAELGHRRIVFLAGPSGSRAGRERQDGAAEEADRRGLRFSHHVAEEAETWLPLFIGSDRPTGMMCWSDDGAQEALDRLATLGIVCPGDVSVVGFDSLAGATRCVPPLTSVAQPVAEIARRSVAMLGELMDGIAPRFERHPVRLDVRQSTRKISLPASGVPAAIATHPTTDHSHDS